LALTNPLNGCFSAKAPRSFGRPGLVAAAAMMPGFGGTIVEDFDFIISADSSTNANYLSNTFAGFDPALGTLNTVTVSLTGSLTWNPGPSGHEKSETLQFFLETPASAFQMFMTPADVLATSIST
jgi:hypothetical protein